MLGGSQTVEKCSQKNAGCHVSSLAQVMTKNKALFKYTSFLKNAVVSPILQLLANWLLFI